MPDLFPNLSGQIFPNLDFGLGQDSRFRAEAEMIYCASEHEARAYSGDQVSLIVQEPDAVLVA